MAAGADGRDRFHSPARQERDTRLRSGDDVGEQNILQLHNAVLERQLALLHPLNEHLVGDAGSRKRMDCGVEVGMFLPLGGQLEAQGGFLFPGQRQHERDPAMRDIIPSSVAQRQKICILFSTGGRCHRHDTNFL